MHVRQRLGASERHACRVLGQSRSTQHRRRKVRADEAALRSDVVRLASRFGRYGYRQITNLLRIEGWRVNHKRVERIWREEGLKVPRTTGAAIAGGRERVTTGAEVATWVLTSGNSPVGNAGKR